MIRRMRKGCGVALLLTSVLGLGCPPSDSSKSDADKTAPADQDPLANAPQGWAQLAAWATPQLGQPLPGKPVPEPVESTPKWPIVRLEERLGQATIRCQWKSAQADSQALLTLGPYRSDRPGDRFQVQAQPGGIEPGINLVAKGFTVQANRVGSIVIELRQPFGRHFDLRWSRAGRIRVPLPDNNRFWTLSIATDGLAEWSGTIRQMAIKTDGIGSEPIEIRSIAFVGQASSFPEAVGVRRVSLDRWTRDTLYMHSPAEVVFHALKLPAEAKFQFGIGGLTAKSNDPIASHGPLSLEVLVLEDGARTSVFKQSLAQASSWTDVDVSLKAWAGKTVSIVLKTDTPDHGSVACWANPVIYQPQQRPPCVIIYLIDALSAEHIDLYGYARPTMPRLKAMAEDGVWFSNMFANSPRTVESVPDLMLSLPTWRHGVYHPSAAAADKLVTLAEVLRQGGFATASFCTNVNAGPRQNIDQGFDHFVDRISYWWSGATDRTVPIDEVLEWLHVHRDRPTFIYIHTAEPHAPYTPPEGFAGRFDPDYAGTVDGTYDRKTGYKTARNQRDVEHIVALYDEEVAYADHRLGLFVDAIDRADLLDRALILVTSDHGEQFGQHGAWEHGDDLHNELLRIPLVVFGPGIQRRGRVKTPAQLYDLMPTILDLFDLDPPYALAGDSLVPLLTETPDPQALQKLSDRTLVSSNHASRPRNIVQYAIIEAGRWKLMHQKPIKGPGGKRTYQPYALFDLQQDPTERTDVIDRHPEIAQRLLRQLLKRRSAFPPLDSADASGPLHMDPQQLEELRSLGYID